LEESRAATVAEIRKKNTRKAQAPGTFTDLLDILKTYANLLLVLFGQRCPFLQELVKDVILPLQKFIPMARKLMARTTLAAILWATFKQGCHFTLGQIEESGERTPEWDTAVTMIRSKSDFSLLEVPLTIKGVHTVHAHTGAGKRKQQEPEDYKKPAKDADDKVTPKNQKQDTYVGQKIPVHAVIQAKIIAALPDRFQMKKLAAACGIKDLAHIFPEERLLCLHVALRGWCPFHQRCKKRHDNSVITDKMADNAITFLEPFIKDPTILSDGK